MLVACALAVSLSGSRSFAAGSLAVITGLDGELPSATFSVKMVGTAQCSGIGRRVITHQNTYYLMASLVLRRAPASLNLLRRRMICACVMRTRQHIAEACECNF